MIQGDIFANCNDYNKNARMILQNRSPHFFHSEKNQMYHMIDHPQTSMTSERKMEKKSP